MSNVVTIAATDANASETGPDPGVFTFTRTGPTTFNLPVNYSIGGTATNFFDYQTISSQVTILAGQTSATVTITPVADALDRAGRDGDPDHRSKSGDVSVGARIPPPCTIADGVSERGAPSRRPMPTRRRRDPIRGVHVHAHGADHLDLPVNYSIGGTATNFFDYQTISSQVTVPAGQPASR